MSDDNEVVDRDVLMPVENVVIEGFEVKNGNNHTTVLTDVDPSTLRVRHIHDVDIRVAEIMSSMTDDDPLKRVLMHLRVGRNNQETDSCEELALLIAISPAEMMEMVTILFRTLMGKNQERALKPFFALMEQFMEEYIDMDLVHELEKDIPDDEDSDG